MNMNTRHLKKLFLAISAGVLLSSCASGPTSSDGADSARRKLMLLQADSELATRAPVEIKDADLAVSAAEKTGLSAEKSEHLVYIADHKVDIANYWAQSRLYEDQRVALNEASAQARLDSRTLEADIARRDAVNARSETERARNETGVARNQAAAARSDTAIARDQAAIARSETEFAQDQAANARNEAFLARNQTADARSDTAIAQDQAAIARSEAELAQSQAANARNEAFLARNQTADARSDTAIARDQAAIARSEAELAQSQAANARDDAMLARNQATSALLETEELERQILALNAMNTDRGLVVTLGDVLFQTGEYAIQGGNTGNLDKLALFLNRYEDRTVSIEGHTDNVGTSTSNYSLSQNRANEVKKYLVTKGIAANRLNASGLGEDTPVSSNESATGRQQNRRVEVIIANNDVSLPLH